MVNLNRFYTYAYLREDRTPYYIGKGSGNRIYDSKGRPCKKPKDKSRIIFLKQNLTEEDAFKHEIYMIAVFGRKNLGTGILHNRTDGGDGSSGAIRPQEVRKKISNGMKGRSFTEKHLKNLSIARKGRKLSEEAKTKISQFNKGKKLSDETKRKMSESRKGRIISEETKKKMSKAKLGKSTSLKGKSYKDLHGEKYLDRIEHLRKCNTGKIHSEETKLKISNSKKGCCSWNKGISVDSKYVYTVKSPDGKILVTKNMNSFCKENQLNSSCMFRMMKGRQKQHKGWIFIKKEYV